MDNLFWVFFVAMAAFGLGPLLYRWARYKSFSAAMFGAPIERTLGEIMLKSPVMSSRVLKVHALGPGNGHDKSVGLQLVSKAPFAFSTMPINLSLAQAHELVQLLESEVRS